MTAPIRTFASGASRDTDENKLDYEGFLSPVVLRAYAEYMHRNRRMADGSLRDSDNWQKGMPRAEYVKSLTRHHFELWGLHRMDDLDSDEAEDALCGVMFNAMGLLFEILKDRDDGDLAIEAMTAAEGLLWPATETAPEYTWTELKATIPVSAHRVAPQFKPGDRVRVYGGGMRGTVQSIDDRGIHVLWDGQPPNESVRWREDELERVA